MSWIQSDLQKTSSPSYIPCSWSDGTDAEIAEALEQHYAGNCDLADYWAVGDERTISLNSMTHPNPNSNKTIAGRNYTAVIVAMNHTDLATPINGHDKAAITVQTKQCLGTFSYYDGYGMIYLRGQNANWYNFVKWSNLYIRTYFNSTVLNAFPTDFKSMIKPAKNYRHTTYNGTTAEEVIDNLFLPSYPEVFGTESTAPYIATNPTEGTQFEYFMTSANRCKIADVEGYPTDWWIGSPHASANNPYSWLITSSYNGNCSSSGGVNGKYMSPVWVM